MAYAQAYDMSNGTVPTSYGYSSGGADERSHVALPTDELKRLFNSLLDSVAISPAKQACNIESRLETYFGHMCQRQEEQMQARLNRLDETIRQQNALVESQTEELRRWQAQSEENTSRQLQRLQEDEHRRAESSRQTLSSLEGSLRESLAEAQKLCERLRESGQREAPSPAPAQPAAPFKAPPTANAPPLVSKSPPPIIQPTQPFSPLPQTPPQTLQPPTPIPPLSTMQDSPTPSHTGSIPVSKPPQTPSQTESIPPMIPQSKPPPAPPNAASAPPWEQCIPRAEAKGSALEREWETIAREEGFDKSQAQQAPPPSMKAPPLPQAPPPLPQAARPLPQEHRPFHQSGQERPGAIKAPPPEASSYLHPAPDNGGSATGNTKSSPPFKAPPQGAHLGKTSGPPFKAPASTVSSPPYKAPPPTMGQSQADGPVPSKKPPPPLPPGSQPPVPSPHSVQY